MINKRNGLNCIHAVHFPLKRPLPNYLSDTPTMITEPERDADYEVIRRWSRITQIDQEAIYQRIQMNFSQMFQEEEEGVVEDKFYQVLLQLGVEVAVAPGEGGVEEEELTKDRTVWNWQQEQERKEKLKWRIAFCH